MQISGYKQNRQFKVHPWLSLPNVPTSIQTGQLSHQPPIVGPTDIILTISKAHLETEIDAAKDDSFRNVQAVLNRFRERPMSVTWQWLAK